MKKNLLKHTLVIATLSVLTITACSSKTAKESSAVSPTEAAKESSSVNSGEAEKESMNADSEETEKENSNPKSTESESAKEGEKEQPENKSNSPLVGAYKDRKSVV